MRHKLACLLLASILAASASDSTERTASPGEESYAKATALLARGNLKDALPLLEEAYKLGLRHAGVLFSLARCRFAAGREDAAAELLAAMVGGSESPNLLLQAGKLFFEWVLYRQAVDALEKSWRKRPGHYETGMYLALSHYLLERYASAEAVLKAMETDPAPPADYRNLAGAVAARLGRWDEAQEHFELALRQDPRRADAYLNLGMLHLERGDRHRAMELFEKGSEFLRPGTKITYMMRRRTDCSGVEPPPLKDGDPARGQFYNNFALSLQKMQNWQSALEIYLLALSVDPKSVPAYGGVGLLCQELGNPEVGRVFLRRGIELDPAAAELHYYLGSVEESLGEAQLAARSYRTAIRLKEPEPPPRYLVRLGMLLLSDGAESEAESLFLRALQADPNFAQAHYVLGKLYLNRHDFQRAGRSLAEAVRLDPLMQEGWYAYGLACLRSGKQDEGRQVLESFRRKKALRAASGMSRDAPPPPRMSSVTPP